MLTSWLTSTTIERFRDEHFQKAPVTEAGSARAAGPLMTWDKVAALLAASPRPDLIISRDGRFLKGADPASIDEAQELFTSGCSIVLRNVERFDEALAEMARSFGNELEGEVNIHAFATPRASMGFGWHYDCEDVFIVQTAGTKQYWLRRNTINPSPVRAAMPRDMQFEKETSPTLECTLVAGDWLYIPRGWWHRAEGLDDALSLSVGVLSPAAAG